MRVPFMSYGEVDAEDGADVGGLAGLHELHCAVAAIPVGEREGVHAVVGSPFDEDTRMGSAVPQ
jgi:hypothetical protein